VIPVALERPGAVRFEALPPLALYVHIPWCVRKCPYCDFNSHERTGSLPEAEYLAALFRDLESSLPQIWGRRVISIFIGGGTPSLFSPESIDALLSGVRARLALDPQAEITLEANPGTVEAARFRGFRSAGVNRISIGVQSFDERMLAALGRIHSGDEARRAIDAAAASFDNVNIDLMYGLPGQTPAMARADLDQALRLALPHVSAYQLTIEPNTVFWSKPPALPEHDVAADMQLAAEESLCAAGYEHYETSAFARRLPRDRRRRARQAQLPRPCDAPRARQAAQRVYEARCARGGERGLGGRAAVRVHAERASSRRGFRRRALQRAHWAIDRKDRKASDGNGS
jgi:oxygen-independent coproporphyrinogen-3 oxidase